MIETALVIGFAGLIFPVLIYNTRKISAIEKKVDLIYNNINVNIEWRKNHKKGKE